MTADAKPAAGAENPDDPEGADGWLTQGERGAMWGMRLVFRLARLLGRWPVRQLVRVIALYYALFDKTARKASRDWLTRIHGAPPTAKAVRSHIFHFAQVALDRVFLLQGESRFFEVTRTGDHHLAALVEANQGAVLLGAHLGSFEAMRAGARDEALPLHIVGHFENARMINALLAKLDPGMAARVIHVGDDPVSLALTVRDRVDEGGLIALLGDRVGLNDKSIRVPFLGKPAPFPTGPFLLAAMLRCPVYLVFGLYSEPNRYDLFCEPFAERIALPRPPRQEALEEWVARFAERLEHYARKAPNNWFNFYDFWDEAADED